MGTARHKFVYSNYQSFRTPGQRRDHGSRALFQNARDL